MENLFGTLNSITPISTDLKQRLENILNRKIFKKRSYLLQEGQISNEIYFIEKGSVRCFYDNQGIEVCVWFMSAGDFVISIESFLRQSPSYQYIQALEDCTLWSVSATDLKRTYELYPEFHQHRASLLEKYYIESERRQRMLSLKTAKERFQYLLKTNIAIIQQMPSKYVASYLNIDETYYSKIKGESFR